MGVKAVALCAMLVACGRFDFEPLTTDAAGSGSGVGAVCTAHWCWEHPPGPENATLRAIAGTSATNVWAVGDAGVIRAWDGTAWTRVPFPSNDALVAIAMPAANDVAVATHAGIIWHWDGSTWTLHPTPTGSSIAAFWVTPTGTVIGAGDLGTMTTDLSAAPARPVLTAATAIHGRNASDVSVTGLFNYYSHWNGSAWSEVSFADFPHAVWNTSTTTWVGAASGIWSCTPTACTESIGQNDTRAMWGASDNDVWAVGAGVVHWNGTTWATFAAPAGPPLDAIWGAAANDVWAVGNDGRIAHFDGSSWSDLFAVTPAGPTFTSAWAASGTDLWLGAISDMAVYRFDTQIGMRVAQAGIGDELWGRSTTDVYMNDSANHSVLHWDGTTSSDEQVTVSQPEALTLTPGGEALVGDYSGTGQIWSGGQGGPWSLAFTSPGGVSGIDLFTGACSSANNDVIFVARYGQASIRIGGTWAENDTQTQRFLLSCAWVGSQAWAVGGDTLEHYSAGTWTTVSSFPTRQNLTDIKALGQSLLVATSHGSILSGDGTTFQEEAVPTAHDLHKLAVAPDGTVFAAGVDGVVLRRQ